MTSKTSFSQDPRLKESLLRRGDMLSAIALRDLARYYVFLNQCLVDISFTEGQARLLCDTLKGYDLDNNSEQVKAVCQRVVQAIERDQLNQKWGVNGEVLIRKLQAFSSPQAVALVDAVEQYWVRDRSYPNESPEIRLLRVNLIKCCDSAL